MTCFVHFLFSLDCNRLLFCSLFINSYILVSCYDPSVKSIIRWYSSSHFIISLGTLIPLFSQKFHFLWPDQSNLLASVPTQMWVPETSISYCERWCLIPDALDRFANHLFFSVVNQLISAEMCKTAEWGAAILGQSIDEPSSRGKTFLHNSAVLMTGHFAGACGDGKKRWRKKKSKAHSFLCF